MTTISATLITAEELQRLSFPGKQVELARGRLLIREPPGSWHGRIAAELTVRVGAFARRQDLGIVFAQDTGFRIATDPDTVRAPDLAFVSRHRAGGIARRGYAALAPDLVVEIVSPDDRPGEILAKVADWLDAGTRLVWVIDPERFEGRIYRLDGSIALLDREGILDGEQVLPGFTCSLRDILD